MKWECGRQRVKRVLFPALSMSSDVIMLHDCGPLSLLLVLEALLEVAVEELPQP